MWNAQLQGLVCCLGLAALQAPLAHAGGRNLALTYRSRVDGSAKPYRLYVPASYDGSRPYPLVVALHGTTGDQNTFFANPKYLIQPIAAAADEHGVIVLSPYGRGPREWRGTGELDLFEAMAEVRRSYRIDPDRVYLTGHSMGGTGSAHVDFHHPDLFAAVAPLASAFSFPWLVPNARHVPFWWIAGGDDKPLFHAGTMLGVDRMQALRFPVRFTMLPGKDHYGPVGDMEAVVAWLLQHRRVALPQSYAFVVETPLHGQAYRTRVHRLVAPGRLANVEVTCEGSRVTLTLGNVAEIAVFAEPARGRGPTPLEVWVGKRRVFQGPIDAGEEVRLSLEGTRWSALRQQAARLNPDDFPVAPIAQARAQVDMSGTEAALANWMTDAMRWATGAELAVINRQHYRGQAIPPGAVDMVHLLDAMPITDRPVVTARLTGRELLEILDDNVPDPAKDRHYVKDGPYSSRLVQISGAHYTFDPTRPPGSRIVESDLVPDRTYTVCFDGAAMTNDVMMLMAGRFGKIPYRETESPLGTVLYGYAVKTGTIEPRIEGRVRQVQATASHR